MMMMMNPDRLHADGPYVADHVDPDGVPRTHEDLAVVQSGDVLVINRMQDLSTLTYDRRLPYLLNRNRNGYMNSIVKLASAAVLVVRAAEINVMPSSEGEHDGVRPALFTMAVCLGTAENGAPCIGFAHLTRSWVRGLLRVA